MHRRRGGYGLQFISINRLLKGLVSGYSTVPCALENKPLCLNRDNKEITNSGEDSAREEKARDVVPLNVVVLVIVITILTHLVMFVQELFHPFFWNIVFLG